VHGMVGDVITCTHWGPDRCILNSKKREGGKGPPPSPPPTTRFHAGNSSEISRLVDLLKRAEGLCAHLRKSR
jgi:hypothetical protein